MHSPESQPPLNWPRRLRNDADAVVTQNEAFRCVILSDRRAEFFFEHLVDIWNHSFNELGHNPRSIAEDVIQDGLFDTNPLRNPRAIIVALERHGLAPVGISIIGEESSRELMVEHLAVLPEYRRQGCGILLQEASMIFGRARQYRTLETFAANSGGDRSWSARLQRWYAARGTTISCENREWFDRIRVALQ